MDKLKTPATVVEAEAQGVTKVVKLIIPKNRDDGCVIIDKPPLITQGVYKFGFLYYETARLFNQPKLILWFTLLSDGEYHGVKLKRFYNVRSLIGKSGKEGKYKPSGWSSDLIREYANLFGGVPDRLDRFSLKPFNNVIITGEVKTVSMDSKKRGIPACVQYSVIERLIKAEEIEYN